MLQVYVRRKKQRLLEMEIMSVTAGTEQGLKAARQMVEELRTLMFPGTGKSEDTKLKQMRAMVEAEAGKVYVLGRDDRMSRETLNRALTSKNKDLAAWAAREVHKENMAKARLKQDLKRKKGAQQRLPPGTPHLKA